MSGRKRICKVPHRLAIHLLLFLEQVFEGLTGVIRAQCRGSGCFLFDHYAHRVEGAFVALILAGDALRNGLRALKSAGGIEVRTLLAGMKIKTALGTLSDGFREGL